MKLQPVYEEQKRIPLLIRRAVEAGGNASPDRAFSSSFPALLRASEPLEKFAFSIFPLATRRTSKSALALVAKL